MSKISYCSRVFDPYYTYLQASRQIGEHPELKAILDAIGNEHLILTREEDFEKVYPVKTFFHHFKRRVAVITNTEDSYRCQTFIDGIINISFDIFDDYEIAKDFFKESKDNLTVIDYFNGKELKPDFESVINYAKNMLKIEKELNEHKTLINEYKNTLNGLVKDCEVLYSCSPSVSYKSLITLMNNCTNMANNLFYSKYYKDIKNLESYLEYKMQYESEVKMLGLYIYVINHGINNKRFLRHGASTLSLSFNRTLNDCRKFIAKNEGIVDKYIDYMHLNANERENLIYLLTKENLFSNGSKYIGDDLFC